MNFKERGITIGDLTILLIVILLSFFIIAKNKESNTEKQNANLYQFEIHKKINN